MSIQQERRAERRGRILDALSTEGMTLPELTEALGLSYYTIRADVYDMVKDGMVSASMMTRDKAVIYNAGRSRPMPMVYHKATNTKIPLTLVAESYASSPAESASSRAALDVGLVALELLYNLALAVVPVHPNHASLDNKTAYIAALRARLSKDIIQVETILNIAKDMQRDMQLWDKNHLMSISGDSLFDPEAIIVAYEKVLSYRAHKALTTDPFVPLESSN